MMETKDEHVLCVTRNVWKMLIGKGVDSITHDVSNHGILLYRSYVEKEDDYLQIIPYIVLTSSNCVYTYKRNGYNEDRLRGLLSIGVGGHLNSNDYYKEAERELLEETGISQGVGEPLAVIQTDDEVGKHHIGILHCIEIDKNHLKPSSEIRDGSWVSYGYLQMVLSDSPNSLESWTADVLKKDCLREICHK